MDEETEERVDNLFLELMNFTCEYELKEVLVALSRSIAMYIALYSKEYGKVKGAELLLLTIKHIREITPEVLDENHG